MRRTEFFKRCMQFYFFKLKYDANVNEIPNTTKKLANVIYLVVGVHASYLNQINFQLISDA